MSKGRIVDGHVHFWDPGRMEYPWLKEEPALNRFFGPQELRTEGYDVAAMVVVEAGCLSAQAFDEVRWVEELSACWPTIERFVAQVPLERGVECRGYLTWLSEHSLVAGVRRNLQDERPGFALGDDFIAGVGQLPDYDLCFDLCVRNWQLPEVTELVARLPAVTFVLDHLGKPGVVDGSLDPWRENISRLAARPNVVCKLSGLATEANIRFWRAEDVLPYLRHALAQFGADRCLVGGDWPVATVATSYGRWLDVVDEALTGLPVSEQSAVLQGTAARVYRLRLPDETEAR